MRALSPTMTLMGSMVELMEPSKASEVIDRQELMREEILDTLPHLRRLPERVDRLLTHRRAGGSSASAASSTRTADASCGRSSTERFWC